MTPTPGTCDRRPRWWCDGEAMLDVVHGGGGAVVAERRLQVGVVFQVLRLVEGVDRAALGLPMGQVVPFPVEAVGAERRIRSG